MSSTQQRPAFDVAAFQAKLDRSFGLTRELVDKLLPARTDRSTVPNAKSGFHVPSSRVTGLPFELRPERLGLGAQPKDKKPTHPAEQRLQSKLTAAKFRQAKSTEAATSERRALVDYGSDNSDETESRARAFTKVVPTAAVTQRSHRHSVSPNPFSMALESRQKRQVDSISAREPTSLPLSPKVPYRPDVSPTASADEGIDMPEAPDDSEDDEAESRFSSPSNDPVITKTDADGRVQKKRKRKRRKGKKFINGSGAD